MSVPSQSAANPAAHDTSEAFQLVQDLASQLSSGQLRLPSLPEVVLRIRRTLEDPDFDVEALARLLSSEPVLAGTILRLANSVTYRRGAAETASMTTAVARIGASLVRTASMDFALKQLRGAAQFRHLEQLLAPEWGRGRAVAGLCHALGRVSRKAHPDEMLLIGLVHNVGRIFILSHAEHYPITFANPAAVADLMQQWHPSVGSAIAESWNLPEKGVQAIAQQSTADAEQDHRHAVADILVLAIGMAAAGEDEAALAALLDWPATRRLGLELAQLGEAVHEGLQWQDLLA